MSRQLVRQLNKNINILSLTLATPDIHNVKVMSVTPWRMNITWTYYQQSLTKVLHIKVGLQFHYSNAGTDDTGMYPLIYYVDATLQKISITDEFHDKASFVVQVHVCLV